MNNHDKLKKQTAAIQEKVKPEVLEKLQHAVSVEASKRKLASGLAQEGGYEKMADMLRLMMRQ
ncbi:MAG: hypothetical protein ACOYK8_01300 [Alphaproteobacteria bacterium]